MPHGVLFRSGEEGKIRTGLLDDDIIEAVIGLGPQLFYGTGIPACILVLRPKGSKPAERKNKVLIINADREYREGRAQNYLEPEHIEKIVSAYREFKDIENFARVVSRHELEDNNDNLNIRRYVDTTPPPEPQDVRAHLHGGVPQAEVAAKGDLFSSHGFDIGHVFVERDADYYDFKPEIESKRQLTDLIESDAGLLAAEAVVTEAIDKWWSAELHRLGDLKVTAELVPLRQELLSTFGDALASTTMLDRFQIDGIVASWWGKVLPDLKALATLGFKGLVDAWITTVFDALEEEKANINPLDHKVAKALLPDYLQGLAETRAETAELDALIVAASTTDEEDNETLEAEGPTEAELKDLKRRLASSKRKLKSDRASFRRTLGESASSLSDMSAIQLVEAALRADLHREAEQRVGLLRRTLVDDFAIWWNKYRVTLRFLEAERDNSAAALERVLAGLGYE
jgi:type I restriction enzyme M protein